MSSGQLIGLLVGAAVGALIGLRFFRGNGRNRATALIAPAVFTVSAAAVGYLLGGAL
ncbi:glycine zipper 2TM domain-containing protein [Nakamurella deserti]|uniref:glycine zipper 2TM domain-containing protein n=1 Tax=Nakamurella deserti TaxID=2164074 RepID=UPI001300B327|nr:glycine zipper 2TM domain-containing protein [Nakamurella deserti]